MKPCSAGIALFDHAGGIYHALLGFVSPMVGKEALYTTGALFLTYELQRVQSGIKSPLHAVGNLIEFQLGVALFYALGKVGTP